MVRPGQPWLARAMPGPGLGRQRLQEGRLRQQATPAAACSVESREARASEGERGVRSSGVHLGGL